VRQAASRREAYRHFVPITSRWNDIDVFGHINNAEYYAFFDTAVMRFMVESPAAASAPWSPRPSAGSIAR
jgi:acyl-CoA thioester hydrolase